MNREDMEKAETSGEALTQAQLDQEYTKVAAQLGHLILIQEKLPDQIQDLKDKMLIYAQQAESLKKETMPEPRA